LRKICLKKGDERLQKRESRAGRGFNKKQGKGGGGLCLFGGRGDTSLSGKKHTGLEDGGKKLVLKKEKGTGRNI